jgi:hypothetical protein
MSRWEINFDGGEALVHRGELVSKTGYRVSEA